jgi:hypothetical protein
MEGHAMRRVAFLVRFAILVAASSGIEAALGDPIYVDQGRDWTTEARTDFYTRDQGSRLINLAWLQALKGRDGQSFLSDGLFRYGFLPNPGSSANLPIGVHATGPRGSQIVGITCSACHTRQLEVDGKKYRIDGGPAFIDFQAFLSDLDKAVGDVIASDASFVAFAAVVLQSATPTAADIAALRKMVDAWHRRFHAFVAGTLPPVGWGPGRIDAVGIIFNRISGTDVGPPPDLLIPKNMRIAEAPVRFPFLWNSPKQYLTDWAGFVLNGISIFAIARNAGQALSFANFEPKRSSGSSFSYVNTIDFDGLNKLEESLRAMDRPIWPKEWPLDLALAKKGGEIYKKECSKGCHEIKAAFSLSDPLSWLSPWAWATPVTNVGTDTRQFDELGWKVKTGAMAGAGFPLIAKRLQEEDYAVHMMFSAVAGTILEYKLGLGTGGSSGDGFGTLPPDGHTMPSLNPVSLAAPPTETPDTAQPAGVRDSLTIESGTVLSRTVHRGAYEARVLEGIWAAAPYLHNGSVPTLAELLKPSAQRMSQFKLGAKYDVENVGLVVTQDGPTRHVTDCSDLNSGNSRCGHEYGTSLSEPEKKALLEYLKTL